MPSLVMTIIAVDRPGLVQSIATVVADHQANWLESRMAHLGGHFAGILRVEVADEAESEMLARLEALDGFQLIVHKDSEAVQQPDAKIVTLDLIGNDRPGIVREITSVLAKAAVNVEEFFTECRTAPMAGGDLFHATAQLRLPSEMSVGELRGRLEAIASDLMVDVNIQE